jgi:iron complex transport system substrate-binding protein
LRRGIVVFVVILVWVGVLRAQTIRSPEAVSGLASRPAPAQRIVSLAPHATELVYSLGLGERIVGADESSNYPAPALRIPRIGRAGALDIERIVALKPDLVIAWGSGNVAGQVAQLRRLGLNVFTSEPSRLDEIAVELRHLAALGGVSARGERVAGEFEQGLAELRLRYQAKAPVSVFYQIWHEPLMTVNQQHSISAVIRLCGGRNVFAGLSNIAPTVNIEAVLRADPQMIIGSGSDDTRPQWLDDWRRWPQLRAVKANALVDVPPDLMQRPTVRMLEGARRVCAAIDHVRTRNLTP